MKFRSLLQLKGRIFEATVGVHVATAELLWFVCKAAHMVHIKVIHTKLNVCCNL